MGLAIGGGDVLEIVARRALSSKIRGLLRIFGSCLWLVCIVNVLLLYGFCLCG